MAKGRLLRPEVDIGLKELHEHVDHFKGYKSISISTLVVLVVAVLLTLMNAVSNENYSSMPVSIIAWIIIAAVIWCIRTGMYISKLKKKIRLFLNKENIAKWNTRGMYWSIS